MNKHYEKFKRQKTMDDGTREQEMANLAGVLLFTAANATNHNFSQQNSKKINKKKLIEKENKQCTEWDEKLEDDYFACSECEGYFICPEWEEDSEHNHIFYKIRKGKEYLFSSSHSLDPKPPITNFPVPSSLGLNCSTPITDLKEKLANVDISQLIPTSVKKNGSEGRQLRKLLARPSVITAPEGPIVGKNQTYVIAKFVIQNQSKHKLPKKLFLKKTSKDMWGFATITGEFYLI